MSEDFGEIHTKKSLHRISYGPCKGICSRYKAQKPVGTGRYADGQKRCQICEIFIRFEGHRCPCCNYNLRTKPRNPKLKAKLQRLEDGQR
jgi:hypothetical protein